MRVIEINVSAFGGVKDFRLTLSEGLNALHRPNGWGKSTLAVFVKAMLYGLSGKGARSEDGERKKYMPWEGGVFGGSMSFESARGRFRVERFFGSRESADTFALYDLSTNLPSNAYSERLGEELFGIDADGFARTVFLSHSAPAPKGESVSLSARLAALVEAAEDAGDYDAAAEAIEKRIRYYRTTGNRGRIPTLEGELVTLEREREELLREEKTLRAYREEIERIDERLSALEKEEEHIRASEGDAEESGRSAAARARYDALLSRRGRLRERIRALDADAGGRHPADDMIARAARRAEKYARLSALEAVEEPRLSRGGAHLFFAILLLSLCGLSALCALVLAPLLWIAAGVFLVTGSLCLLLWRRAVRRYTDAWLRYETEKKNRENALTDAEEQLTRALRAIGAPAGMAAASAIEAVSRREVEYRLLSEELGEIKREMRACETAYPDLQDAGGTRTAPSYAARLREILAKAREQGTERARLAALSTRLALRAEALPETEAAIARTRDALREAREAYETLTVTQTYLREAKESLSSRYLDRMRERLDAYLSQLDADAPEILPDASLSLSLRNGTGTHKLSSLSSGWQDLISLCARLSLSDVLFAGTETPMLILDDPLITLDDAHLHAGKLLLARLSERYQILYVYCHADRG